MFPLQQAIVSITKLLNKSCPCATRPIQIKGRVIDGDFMRQVYKLAINASQYAAEGIKVYMVPSMFDEKTQ